MNVFVTGGTGLVGLPLIKQLQDRGDTVVLLTRRPDRARKLFQDACKVVEGDPTIEGHWQDEVPTCDGVINLAGESIFNKRWNSEFKSLLRESRIRSTVNVAAALARHGQHLTGRQKVLVNASATGFYGPHGDEELDEKWGPGSDVLAAICVEWEKAALACQSSNLRVAVIRTGIVLARGGGALAQMLPPFRFFAGGPVGSGRQWMSWVHVQDIVGVFLLALDHSDASGPINGTAPHPVTNKDFARSLGRALHRPSFIPTPSIALRLMLGEVADVVTTGQRVLPKAAERLGYTFRFPHLEGALADLV